MYKVVIPVCLIILCKKVMFTFKIEKEVKLLSVPWKFSNITPALRSSRETIRAFSTPRTIKFCVQLLFWKIYFLPNHGFPRQILPKIPCMQNWSCEPLLKLNSL